MATDWSTYSTWELVLPPNRPSDELLGSLRILLKSIKKESRVCILGSTPEFRTACLEAGTHHVTIIDKSQIFSELCDKLTIPNNNESKMIGDWLDILPQYKNKFDLVLSHLTHGNIKFEQRHIFFKSIWNCLSPKGIFFDFVFQPQPPGYDLNQIVKIFKHKPLNIRTCNDFNSIALFQSSTIADRGCVDTTSIYDIMDKANLPKTIQSITAYTKKITPPGYKWDYAFDKDPSKFGYFNGYEILATIEEPCYSAFYNSACLYILKKTEGFNKACQTQ